MTFKPKERKISLYYLLLLSGERTGEEKEIRFPNLAGPELQRCGLQGTRQNTRLRRQNHHLGARKVSQLVLH